MHSSIYEKRFRLGTSECDINGAWKLASLIEAINNTSNEWSKSLRLWHLDLQDKNVTWVLFRSELQVDRYPQLGEEVTVKVYSTKMRAMFYPRYCLIVDEEGNTAAKASSLLLLIDRDTRKVVSPSERGIEIPEPADGDKPLQLSIERRAVQGEQSSSLYQTQYTDFDVNGHVNNARYIDWMCNAMGIERMKRFEITSASMDFKHEIVVGDMVEHTLTLDGTAFSFSGSVREQQMFQIAGSFRPRV